MEDRARLITTVETKQVEGARLRTISLLLQRAIVPKQRTCMSARSQVNLSFHFSNVAVLNQQQARSISVAITQDCNGETECCHGIKGHFRRSCLME